MATLFISDLHLDEGLPVVTDLFARFLREQAAAADALYILGDLFEAWVGDDDERPGSQVFVEALRAFSDSGVPLFIMPGNRDFLMGERFVARSGCILIPDPTVINLYGTPTVLLHGDSLCSDDVKHQESRLLLRSADWQKRFLSQSLEERIQQAREYRSMSRQHLADAPDAIMDVNADTVRAVMLEHNVTKMIHGHTHRPAIHSLDLQGKPGTRYVLGDWNNTCRYLRCDSSGCELLSYP